MKCPVFYENKTAMAEVWGKRWAAEGLDCRRWEWVQAADPSGGRCSDPGENELHVLSHSKALLLLFPNLNLPSTPPSPPAGILLIL